ncbi:dTDP-4-dehydrorhamnose 3,5-epimerase family protein [Micromonospora saelicesensis]|uniref:dTDP-4-dehydrorhamnose 3,5-epimerase family protein n=1 Tax=Micromonospora saelicesensis TaxID=285676 RepID=UPI003CEEBD10
MLTFRSTDIDGLAEVVRSPRADARGRFARLFDRQALLAAGWRWPVAQINLSETRRRGTVRGFHYQAPPMAEAKLVTCVRGSIWDVAVDIRQGSATFLRWSARALDGEGLNSMLIPAGFAHGFQATSDQVTLVYLHSVEHSPTDERGFDAGDKLVGVEWPLHVAHRSDRDQSFPPLDTRFSGVAL